MRTGRSITEAAAVVATARRLVVFILNYGLRKRVVSEDCPLGQLNRYMHCLDVKALKMSIVCTEVLEIE